MYYTFVRKALCSNLSKTLNKKFLIPFLMLLIIFLGIISCNSFCRSKAAVLADFNNPLTHLKLADEAAGLDDRNLAKKEFNLADQMLFKNYPKTSDQYFAEFEGVKKNVFLKEKLFFEINYWLKVIEQQPTYRDGYLKLAILYFQLNNLDKSRHYWNNAWLLDPNNVKVISLGIKLDYVGF